MPEMTLTTCCTSMIKMRLELWERGNEQPTQLQVVWQRRRHILPQGSPGPGSTWVPVLCFALLFIFKTFLMS